MNDIPEDQATLEEDARLDQPLRRVRYEAGMMLGLEATREEQDYHRRRLTRHQYWLHGYGTLAGMAVRLVPESSGGTQRLRLMVGPGVGIDGLGRELLVHETYCIDLKDWLDAQGETALHEGYDEAGHKLWLSVSVRYKDCAVAAQPVLARKLNLSTDPVQPSRTADSVQLELSALAPPAAGTDAFRPWGARDAVPDDLPAELTEAEGDFIDDAPNEAAAAQRRLHARLLYGLSAVGTSTQALIEELEANAQVLLAHIRIDAPTLATPDLTPENILVNNMVRPFLVTASQLAYLARNP